MGAHRGFVPFRGFNFSAAAAAAAVLLLLVATTTTPVRGRRHHHLLLRRGRSSAGVGADVSAHPCFTRHVGDCDSCIAERSMACGFCADAGSIKCAPLTADGGNSFRCRLWVTPATSTNPPHGSCANPQPWEPPQAPPPAVSPPSVPEIKDPTTPVQEPKRVHLDLSRPAVEAIVPLLARSEKRLEDTLEVPGHRPAPIPAEPFLLPAKHPVDPLFYVNARQQAERRRAIRRANSEERRKKEAVMNRDPSTLVTAESRRHDMLALRTGDGGNGTGQNGTNGFASIAGLVRKNAAERAAYVAQSPEALRHDVEYARVPSATGAFDYQANVRRAVEASAARSSTDRGPAFVRSVARAFASSHGFESPAGYLERNGPHWTKQMEQQWMMTPESTAEKLREREILKSLAKNRNAGTEDDRQVLREALTRELAGLIVRGSHGVPNQKLNTMHQLVAVGFMSQRDLDATLRHAEELLQDGGGGGGGGGGGEGGVGGAFVPVRVDLATGAATGAGGGENPLPPTATGNDGTGRPGTWGLPEAGSGLVPGVRSDDPENVFTNGEGARLHYEPRGTPQ